MNLSEIEAISATVAKGQSEFLSENGISPTDADFKIMPYYTDENGLRTIPLTIWVDGKPIAGTNVTEKDEPFTALLDASGQVN